MNDISLVLSIRNNLNYTKYFYETTRKLYPNVEIAVISSQSIDGTHEWLDSLNDDNLKYFYTDEYYNFSKSYNEAIKLSTKKKIVLVHNDMILGKYFLENIVNVLNKDNNLILSYTTIEPPLFGSHKRPGKIIQDFGSDINSFKYDKFNDFVLNHNNNDLIPFSVLKLVTPTSVSIGSPISSNTFSMDEDPSLKCEIKRLKSSNTPIPKFLRIGDSITITKE